MINLESTINAAIELASGEKKPSVKLAFWASALSTMQELERNGKLVELLRKYVFEALPLDTEELYQYLRQSKARIFSNHIKALRYIEEMERQGKLDGLENIGSNFLEQCVWRKRVYDLLHGHGMSWKTISFAALILDPLHCELVPVDRHVMRRLGKNTDNSPQNEELYLQIEQEVRIERDQEGYANIPLGIFHWLKWEEWRVQKGNSKGNGTVESHASLSCRVY